MDFNSLISTIVNKAHDGSLKGPNGSDFGEIRTQLKAQRYQNIEEVQKRPRAIEAFFIGPRG